MRKEDTGYPLALKGRIKRNTRARFGNTDNQITIYTTRVAGYTSEFHLVSSVFYVIIAPL